MFQALRNRNVALLFGANLISVAGDLVLFVALPFWVYQLTGSALATGIMFAALTIPQLVVSPIAGVFVDRWDRKRLMIVSDILRAGLVAGYLMVNTPDQVWLIYVIAFAESTVSQFFRPATSAVLPTLVDGEQELTRANASLGGAWAMAQLGGPALGGVLVAAFGPHAAALLDAGTYLVSATLIILMHVPARQQMAARLESMGHAVQQISHELMEGVRVVLARPALRVVLGSFGLLFFSQGIINVLLVVIINQLYHVGAQEFGELVSAQGIGGVLGSLLVGLVSARLSPRAMIIGGGVLEGLLIFAMVNQPSVYVAMGLMVLLGIAVVTLNVGLTTLMQIGTDDSNRGRVSSLTQTTMALAQLISIAATSLLAARLGPVIMMDIASVCVLGGGLIAIFAPHTGATKSPGVGMTAPILTEIE